MTQPRTITDAAHAIRSELSTLLDSATAEQVDQRLQILLTQTKPGQSVELLITEELRQFESTRAWMKRYLKGENPDQITRSLGDSRLAGNEALQPATKYVCPIGDDYTWYREGNEPIPLCPTHLVPLVPAQS